MYKAILWDIDGTLLNFLKSENAAIKECFRMFGLPECTDEMVNVYSEINESYWKRLECGEITKPELFTSRFRIPSRRNCLHKCREVQRAISADTRKSCVFQ